MNFNQDRLQKTNDYVCVIDSPVESTFWECLSSSVDLQWVRLDPETVIVATANSGWIHKTGTEEELKRYTTSMKDTDGSINSTANLLDAAIAAAYYQYSNQALANLTLESWVCKLAGHYHLTCQTHQIMREASLGFAIADQDALTSWASLKAKREQDYNRTTLQDLEYLGYDAEAVVQKFCSHQALNMIDYLQQQTTSDLLRCVGYSFTIERIATRTEPEYIQSVSGLLPPSLTCLTSPESRPWLYGSVGVDLGDVQETLEVVARLSAAERIRVARACYETALICFAQPQERFELNAQAKLLLESFKC